LDRAPCQEGTLCEQPRLGRDSPEGLGPSGKPVRSTKERGKPVRISDDQRNPSKTHGRAADQNHHVHGPRLWGCSA